MVKLLSIYGKNSFIDTESIPKSTLQLLFFCSIVGNVVLARKDDKTYEVKNYPSPTYRLNEEVETGFDNDNRNYKSSSERTETNWNGMKGVYGYRNSDAFRMMDFFGRNYGLNGKPLEPGVSSSNPTDVVIKSKDNSQTSKGQANSKIQMKNLIENHRLEQEVLEQKPERLTQINGDESADEEEGEEETTETPSTITSTSTSTTTPRPIEPTTRLTTILSSTTTTTTAPTTTVLPVSPSTPSNNQHREVEGHKSNPQQIPSSDSMKHQHKKSLHSKISVHQLISESMPTLQMSVSPIYFYNKQTRSLVAVPYLIMKSTSKMPLLPGMMDSVGGSIGGQNNLLNYMNSPFNQKLRSQPINHLSPLLEGFESSHHNLEEPETSASSRWMTVQSSSNGQHW